MAEFYKNNYWRLGFASRLYDLLTPAAYEESMKAAVDCLPDAPGMTIMDVGCGSGQALAVLKEMRPGLGRYIGTDVQATGLRRLRGGYAGRQGALRILTFQSNLNHGLPVRKNSADAALAHFSIYTLSEPAVRARVLGDIKEALKPGGRLVMVNPSKTYDAKNIIRESLKWHKASNEVGRFWIKKYLLYPLTLHFGLKFIERQLKKEFWKSYTLEEMSEEAEAAGFEIVRTQTVYANSAYLLLGKIRG